jgi:peptide/nickel transport system substrate-binding protein
VKRLGRRSLLAALSAVPTAFALGRTPNAGLLRLRLPLHFAGLDPHSLDDPLSALFAAAIADPLFSLDGSGKPYPTLARALPERTSRGCRITLRPELVSARGKALSGADAVFSLKRAQGLGGAAVLAAFSAPSADSQDRLAVLVPEADPEALARALASPLTALVPRGFSPLAPDGTGAFKATFTSRSLSTSSSLSLTRNENAARGAAFLDRIELTQATDLADALRAFEVGQVDVGWLGNGLYRKKAGAVPLDGPVFGWIVLRTGLTAKSWGAPGIAGQLTAGLPGAALARFGVHALTGAGSAVRWGGGPAPLLVSEDAPHAVELARALEPLLSSDGNEVRATPLPRISYLEARRSRGFALLLDFVRAEGGDANQSALALLAAVDPALARRPPKNLRSILDATRTLPLGIVGELRIAGAHSPEFEGLDAWQLGNVWVNAEKR